MTAILAGCHPERSEGKTLSIELAPLQPHHRSQVAELLIATGSFRSDEIDVALELFDASVVGDSRDYEFVGVFVESPREVELRADQPTSLFEARAASSSSQLEAGTSWSARRPEAHTALAGYACYGASPGTLGTYDLYWIAVHPEYQGTGGGSRLLDEVERRLNEREARLLVVETSSRTDYESTRRFYERRGYQEHARLADFYAVGDDRLIYAKRL